MHIQVLYIELWVICFTRFYQDGDEIVQIRTHADVVTVPDPEIMLVRKDSALCNKEWLHSVNIA